MFDKIDKIVRWVFMGGMLATFYVLVKVFYIWAGLETAVIILPPKPAHGDTSRTHVVPCHSRKDAYSL